MRGDRLDLTGVASGPARPYRGRVLAAHRPLTPAMRRMLLSAAVLVFGVGVPLLVMTEYTDALFAWTVQPPLTAAFLGGCYWAAGVLELVAAREPVWVRARASVPGVLLFTILTCVVTAVNVRHFNLRSPAAYAWIAVYFCVPPVLAWIWRRQATSPGADEPRTMPMPRWIRATFLLLAAGLLGYGGLMFAAPSVVAGGWPWELNPPEGTYSHLVRMEPYIGAWLLGLGVVAACTARENDLRRVRCVLAAGVALPLLEALALARYPSLVRWAHPVIWVFGLALLALLIASAAGLARLRRAGLTSGCSDGTGAGTAAPPGPGST